MTIEEVYNLHLKTVKRYKNKPYTLRKDFSKFRKEKSYKDYKAVSDYLNYKSESINPVLFFTATAHFHKDDDFIPIKEYTKPSALTNYIHYKRHLDSTPLDDKLGTIIENLSFIKEYCEGEGINFTDYLEYRKDDKSKHSFLNHVKTKKIEIYILFAFKNFFDILKGISIDIETYNFYIPYHLTPFELLKRYNRSDVYKENIDKIRERIYN